MYAAHYDVLVASVWVPNRDKREEPPLRIAPEANVMPVDLDGILFLRAFNDHVCIRSGRSSARSFFQQILAASPHDDDPEFACLRVTHALRDVAAVHFAAHARLPFVNGAAEFAEIDAVTVWLVVEHQLPNEMIVRHGLVALLVIAWK